MTGGAIYAKLPSMVIVIPMTGIAICRGAFENAILMTTRTSHADMRAGQLEG
jgi:hypothetical protein